MEVMGQDSMSVEKLADLGVEPSDIDAFCRKWDVSELSLFGSLSVMISALQAM